MLIDKNSFNPFSIGEFDNSEEEDKHNTFQPFRQELKNTGGKEANTFENKTRHSNNIQGRQSAYAPILAEDKSKSKEFENCDKVDNLKQLPKMEESNKVYRNTRKSCPQACHITQILDNQPEAWLDDVLEDSPFS